MLLNDSRKKLVNPFWPGVILLVMLATVLTSAAEPAFAAPEAPSLARIDLNGTWTFSIQLYQHGKGVSFPRGKEGQSVQATWRRR